MADEKTDNNSPEEMTAVAAEGASESRFTTLEPEEGALISPSLLGKLKQLTVASKKVFRGRMKGERRSKKRGQSVEFADFRNYVAGDDPRHIDWNTYGRLERLYLKLFMEEEDLFVYILLDTSKSMGFGNKFRYAQQLAGALGYIATLNQDHVAVGAFQNGLAQVLRPKRGKGQAPKVMQFIEQLKPEGGTNLHEAARRYLIEHRRPGLLIVISDFMDPAGYEEPLKMFQARGFDVFAIQTLLPEELNPTVRGDIRLVDAESGTPTEVSISPRLLSLYKEAVSSYCEGLENFCKKRGLGYLLANTGDDIEDFLLKYFRAAGLVK